MRAPDSAPSKEPDLKKIIGIVVVCILLVGIGITFSLKRKHGPDVFSDLKVYGGDPKTIYYDPSEILKSMPASMRSGVSAKDLQPMEIRYMKIKNVDFSHVNAIVRRDLAPSDGWNFMTPPTGVKSSFDLDFIQAYKGTNPMAGPMAEPDHALMVMPDYAAISPSVMSGKVSFPKVKQYNVLEMWRLSSWQVTWLKIKSLGHNPYADQNALAKIMQ